MVEKLDLNFDFYYGKEAEQFNFYRIPKLLFSDRRFEKVSIEAKVLYGLLLDRMSLSIKNRWVDKENRVYIYFKVSEAMEYMNICKEKAVKLFSELDTSKGCGLIFRKRQGLGKPSVIYVMNFNSGAYKELNEFDDTEPSNLQRSEKQTSERSEKQTSERSEIPTSGGVDFIPQDVDDSDSNKTNINNNKYNYTEFSDINHIPSNQISGTYRENDVMDEIEERERYRKLISKNIEYEIIVENYSRGNADCILETMLDAVCSRSPYIIVSGTEIPQEVVKSRLLKLNNNHIVYVLDCLYKNTTKIHNIKSYMLTALYNSFSTMEHYYTAEVNHDLYGCN